MSMSVLGFVLLAMVLLGVVAFVIVVIALIRSVGKRPGVTQSSAAAVPPVMDDSMTNPANPMYQAHHAAHHAPPSFASESPPAPSFDSGSAASPSFDAGSSPASVDTGGSNCG